MLGVDRNADCALRAKRRILSLYALPTTKHKPQAESSTHPSQMSAVKTIKSAYRKLALKLHPDVNKAVRSSPASVASSLPHSSGGGESPALRYQSHDLSAFDPSAGRHRKVHKAKGGVHGPIGRAAAAEIRPRCAFSRVPVVAPRNRLKKGRTHHQSLLLCASTTTACPSLYLFLEPSSANLWKRAVAAGGFSAGGSGGGSRSAGWDSDFDFMNYKRPKTKCAPQRAALSPHSICVQSQPRLADVPCGAASDNRRSVSAHTLFRQDEEFYGFGDFFRDLDKELVRSLHRGGPASPRFSRSLRVARRLRELVN